VAISTFVLITALVLASERAVAQVVAVTLRWIRTSFPSRSTTLRVFAQVIRAFAECDRIFSWYVDVLNTNGLSPLPLRSMQKIASDNQRKFRPPDSMMGPIARNYDTFMNLSGAGVATRRTHGNFRSGLSRVKPAFKFAPALRA